MRDSTQEAVAVVVQLISEGEQAFGGRRGDEALSVAREMEAVLVEQFEGNLGHVLLWEQFLRTPKEVAPAVTSVVELLLARDPALAHWLEQSLETYSRHAGRPG